MQALSIMHTQELSAGGAAPLLFCCSNEGRKPILTGRLQILQQVLSILGDIPFVQILDAPARVLGAITAQRRWVAMFFGAVLNAADSAMIGFIPFSLATNAFAFGALKSHTEVTDDTAGCQAGVVHGTAPSFGVSMLPCTWFNRGIRSFSSW